jgi:hypothetical protein
MYNKKPQQTLRFFLAVILNKKVVTYLFEVPVVAADLPADVGEVIPD